MNGTRIEATCAMRRIPPRTTPDTIAAITIPQISLNDSKFVRVVMEEMAERNPLPSMPSGVVKTLTTASASWLAFMMHIVPNIPAKAKKTARGFHFLPSPFSIMYIVPPRCIPCSSLPRNISPSTPSWYLVAIPTSALTHIQNIAPGPPTTSAMVTPAIFPKPMVAATTEARA